VDAILPREIKHGDYGLVFPRQKGQANLVVVTMRRL
jgi:hypothetical protein